MENRLEPNVGISDVLWVYEYVENEHMHQLITKDREEIFKHMGEDFKYDNIPYALHYIDYNGKVKTKLDLKALEELGELRDSFINNNK